MSIQDTVMTRTPWAERDRTSAYQHRPNDPFHQINRALAENIPATLASKEVKAITGYSNHQLRMEIEAGRFPPAINQYSRAWRKWASPDIKAWLIENGLPTVFGKEASDA